AQFQRGTQLNDLLQNAYANSANQALGLGGQYGQGTNQIYNQTLGLRGSQLGGAGAMLANTASTMGLYGTVPSTMGHFGEAMGKMSGYDVAAQQPYQQDRLAQLGAQAYPTKGQYIGEMMGQTGQRWQQVGGSIGGLGNMMSQQGSTAGGGRWPGPGRGQEGISFPMARRGHLRCSRRRERPSRPRSINPLLIRRSSRWAPSRRMPGCRRLRSSSGSTSTCSSRKPRTPRGTGIICRKTRSRGFSPTS